MTQESSSLEERTRRAFLLATAETFGGEVDDSQPWPDDLSEEHRRFLCRIVELAGGPPKDPNRSRFSEKSKSSQNLLKGVTNALVISKELAFGVAELEDWADTEALEYDAEVLIKVLEKLESLLHERVEEE